MGSNRFDQMHQWSVQRKLKRNLPVAIASFFDARFLGFVVFFDMAHVGFTSREINDQANCDNQFFHKIPPGTLWMLSSQSPYKICLLIKWGIYCNSKGFWLRHHFQNWSKSSPAFKFRMQAPVEQLRKSGHCFSKTFFPTRSNNENWAELASLASILMYILPEVGFG